jgi:hypothetical protein
MKPIFTTISFQVDRLHRIEKLIEGTDIALDDLVITCVKKLAKEILKKGFNTRARRYQQKGLGYKPEHFSMSEAEYDFFDDLQKRSRCCFSKLVAIALDLYAEEVLLSKDLDSYKQLLYTKVFFVYKTDLFTFLHGMK